MKATAADLPAIHLFAQKPADLAAIPRLKPRLAQNGQLWVSWYKQASPKHAGLTDVIVRRAGLKAGLVDIKVCAVDDDWSGIKFVIPVSARR